MTLSENLKHIIDSIQESKADDVGRMIARSLKKNQKNIFRLMPSGWEVDKSSVNYEKDGKSSGLISFKVTKEYDDAIAVDDDYPPNAYYEAMVEVGIVLELFKGKLYASVAFDEPRPDEDKMNYKSPKDAEYSMGVRGDLTDGDIAKAIKGALSGAKFPQWRPVND